jgi:hypothetical protein
MGYGVATTNGIGINIVSVPSLKAGPGTGGEPVEDSFLLMETGDFLLLESDDKIILDV